MVFPADPRWPTRVISLVTEVQNTPTASVREEARRELWIVVNSALRRYLRCHAPRLGRLDPADLEDVAAEKSLELVAAAESGKWKVEGRGGAEAAAYVSQAARNGIVDLLRARSRGLVYREDGRMAAGDESENRGLWMEGPPDRASAGPDALVASRDFARALSECAGELPPRSFRVWFFRVFYDMSSKEIARHPEVRLNPGHVDVLLQRCRRAISDCMSGKGHDAAGMPPGTFVELWKRLAASGQCAGEEA